MSTLWPNAFTPNNIIGGFRKTGIYPINPEDIDDKMRQQKPKEAPEDLQDADSTLFTPE